MKKVQDATGQQTTEEYDETEEETYELIKDEEAHVYADERRGSKKAVSVNGSLGRLVIYAQAYREMLQAVGKDEISYVKLVSTPKYPERFWIIPVESKKVHGARGLHKTGKTIMISAKLLISQLKMQGTPTAQYAAHWEPVNKGLLVDLRKKL
jgi:hypothetical protein